MSQRSAMAMMKTTTALISFACGCAAVTAGPDRAVPDRVLPAMVGPATVVSAPDVEDECVWVEPDDVSGEEATLQRHLVIPSPSPCGPAGGVVVWCTSTTFDGNDARSVERYRYSQRRVEVRSSASGRTVFELDGDGRVVRSVEDVDDDGAPERVIEHERTIDARGEIVRVVERRGDVVTTRSVRTIRDGDRERVEYDDDGDGRVETVIERTIVGGATRETHYDADGNPGYSRRCEPAERPRTGTQTCTTERADGVVDDVVLHRSEDGRITGHDVDLGADGVVDRREVILYEPGAIRRELHQLTRAQPRGRRGRATARELLETPLVSVTVTELDDRGRRVHARSVDEHGRVATRHRWRYACVDEAVR